MQALRRRLHEGSLAERKRRHRYSLALQLDMAEAANKEGSSVTAVARQFHVSRRTIQRAKQNYERNLLEEHREKYKDETIQGK